MSTDPYGFSSYRPEKLHIIRKRKVWDDGRVSATFACNNSQSSVSTTSTLNHRELGLTLCARCWDAAAGRHRAFDWQIGEVGLR